MEWKYLCWLGQVSAWFIHSISMSLPSSPLRIHHSSVLRLVWFHYSFARLIYFTNSLNEASLFKSRSGGKSKSCQKGFCIHFKPRHLQAMEFCRWHTEGENLGRLLAFRIYFPKWESTRAVQSPISRCFSTLQQLTRHLAIYPAED